MLHPKARKKLPLRSLRSRLLVFGFGVAALPLSGCSVVQESATWPPNWFDDKDEKKPLPDRMMVIWTDTVLHQPQQPGVRGFGGRVYFYKDKSPDPIEVDGGLAVYAFDAATTQTASSKPEKKFVFTPDQFAEHMSDSEMGKSYSIWIPWDQVGGESRQLSLVTRFEGRSGGVVISDPTIKLLPGLKTPLSHSKEPTATIQQATYLNPPQQSKTTNDDRQAETIDLPPSFYRHILAPPAPNTPVNSAPVESHSVPPQFAPAVVPPSGQPSAPTATPASTLPTNHSPGLQHSFRNTGDYRQYNGQRQIRTGPLPAGWMEKDSRTQTH